MRKEEEFLAHENRAGGSIKIGGDYLGKGDTAAANYVYVDPNSVILNDAIHSGDAGRTIVWSDDTTQYYGNVFARGGTEGGNGGFLETSGKKYLDAKGYADLTAAEGYKKGTYLLDPANITIYGNVDPTFVSTDSSINLASNLKLWLDAADATKVTLTYSNDSMSSAQIDRTGANTLETVTNVNLTSALQVGAKIRIGGANGQTALASDTSNADTFTITAISYDGSKTIITTSETISAAYDDQNIYRGLVSQWSDKSGTNHAVQATATNMPLWVSNGQNGLGIVKFDGSNDVMNNTNNFVIGSVFQTVKTNPTGNYQGFFTGNSDPIGSNFYLIRNNSTSNIFTEGSYLQSFFVNSANTTAFTNSAPMIIGGIDSTPQANLDGYRLGRDRIHAGRSLDGFISETIAYDNALSTNARNLIEQYQSSKWGIALDPEAGAGTEAAEAMGATGYSVFAADYLERLSATADIVLQADNTITLDLKNDALTLVDDRSITLQTTNGKAIDPSEYAKRIAQLNDRFRQTYWGGKVMTTCGVNELSEDLQLRLFRAVSDYDDFDWRNDPHGEHDFGKVEIDNHEFFWKIDYYDARMECGSEDPANPDVTTRVLTMMLTSEY